MKTLTVWAAFLCASVLYPQEVRNARPDTADSGPIESVLLVAAGDLLLGARAEPVIRSCGADAPFDSVRSILQSADIALANLEAPFAESGQGVPYPKQYNFRVPPEFAGGLVAAGFHVLTLANNHVLDYGPEGLRSTLHILDSLNVGRCGAGLTLEEAHRPLVLERRGMRFGFLAYSLTYPDSFWAAPGRPGTAFPESARMRRCIRGLKDSTDFVIVSFHWGGEKLHTPKTYQRSHAHRAVDAGADLVIGHHPHVVQGIEIYRNTPIAYSLGNFIFGSYSPDASGALLEVEFHPGGALSARIVPIHVNNYDVRFQPRILRNREKSDMIRHINAISEHLNAGAAVLNAAGTVRIPP